MNTRLLSLAATLVLSISGDALGSGALAGLVVTSVPKVPI